jgi:hypothetical protein
MLSIDSHSAPSRGCTILTAEVAQFKLGVAPGVEQGKLLNHFRHGWHALIIFFVVVLWQGLNKIRVGGGLLFSVCGHELFCFVSSAARLLCGVGVELFRFII